jgi:replication fork clamp-binding protein CrfC
MAEVVSELLREHLSPTVTYVASLIAIQRAYINTNHPEFLGAAGAMASLESEGKKKKRAEKKRVSVYWGQPYRAKSSQTVCTYYSLCAELIYQLCSIQR